MGRIGHGRLTAAIHLLAWLSHPVGSGANADNVIVTLDPILAEGSDCERRNAIACVKVVTLPGVYRNPVKVSHWVAVQSTLRTSHERGESLLGRWIEAVVSPEHLNCDADSLNVRLCLDRVGLVGCQNRPTSNAFPNLEPSRGEDERGSRETGEHSHDCE